MNMYAEVLLRPAKLSRSEGRCRILRDMARLDLLDWSSELSRDFRLCHTLCGLGVDALQAEQLGKNFDLSKKLIIRDYFNIFQTCSEQLERPPRTVVLQLCLRITDNYCALGRECVQFD